MAFEHFPTGIPGETGHGGPRPQCAAPAPGLGHSGLMPSLAQRLAREQRAFLARPRRDWGPHLDQARDFLGGLLAAADPGRPVLVLGAGAGLEVPWARAPRGTVGWDADPWSRLRTALRHRRWPAWHFEEVTGAIGPLAAAARRAARETWSGRVRCPEAAQARLAALLPTLPADCAVLRSVLADLRPGTVLAANLMGQFGEVAHREVEAAFAPLDPWDEAPELEAAFQAWHCRVITAFLEVLGQSGAALGLLHDRAVLEGPQVPTLGGFADRWVDQLRGAGPVEAHDPLAGLDVLAALAPRRPALARRWWWPVGPGQVHLVEALAYEAFRTPDL